MLLYRIDTDDLQHCIEVIELRTNGPTFYEARCECGWSTPRGGEDRGAVDAAAQRHAAPYVASGR